jgi:glycosyltransferase involved in cell wall biosynthesis
VSVALATHNGERFLSEQLASLARQSQLPLELVVCDDDSSDGTLEVLAAFAAEAPFDVTVHPNDGRLGFAETFLRAASLCKGEAIGFCDQDDVWLAGKIERCGRELQRPGVLLAMHSSRLANEALEPTRRLYPHIRRDRVAPPLAGDPWLPVRGMSMVFAARLLRVADPAARPPSHYLDGKMNHDEWIYVLARGLGAIAYVAEPLALYRQHARNVTGAADETWARDGLRTGATYYSRRREQALVLADVFTGKSERAADWYRRQALSLERRLAVYDEQAPARVRLRRLAGLARGRLYRKRTDGGFGLRGLLRDAAMITLRRRG